MSASVLWANLHQHIHFFGCLLICCSVTCQEMSLICCSRWHVRSFTVCPSGSRMMRRWESVCGGATKKVEPQSVELSSDATNPATTTRVIITLHYSRLALADILVIDASFSYETSLCYAKSYSANTVGCLFCNSTVTVLVKMSPYTVCHCRYHCAFIWRALSSLMP